MSGENDKSFQKARMIVFDKNLHTVAFSPAFVELFKAPYQSQEFLKNTDVNFYAPDFGPLGELDRFHKVAESGGAYIIDAYQTVIDEVKKPFVDRICVYSMNGMIYTLHIDVNNSWDEGQFYMGDMIKYCENLQHELSRVSLKSLEMESFRSSVMENIDNVILPLLSLLQTSGLDERQSGIVDTIINSLCSATEPFLAEAAQDLELTKRESQIDRLVEQGKTTKEIADILMISPRTVDFHRANINKKKRKICIRK